MFECRFKLIRETREIYNKEAVTVEMQGEQSEPFGKYTPSASMKMVIINSEVEKQLEIGAIYRVTFEKITE